MIVNPTSLPDFIPSAVQSFNSRPIGVGDAVMITWGQLVKRYTVTAVNENGEGDITVDSIENDGAIS